MFPVTSLFKKHTNEGAELCVMFLFLMWSHMLMNLGVWFFFKVFWDFLCVFLFVRDLPF